MKLRLLLLPLVALLAIAVGIRAQEGKKDDQTELGAKMEKVGGAWRKLGRGAIADPAKKEDNLKAIAIVKENLTAALKYEPALAAEKTGAEKEKFVAAYQEKLKAEIAKVEKIEAALKAGNTEEAAKLYGEVGQEQKEAHTQFKKKKKMN